MAAQVDAFSRESLEPFRQWLRRDIPPRDEQRSSDTGVLTAIRQGADVSPLGQLPSQPSGRRHEMRSGASRLSSPPLAQTPDGIVQRAAAGQNAAVQASAHTTPASERLGHLSRSPCQGPGPAGSAPLFPPTPPPRLVSHPLPDSFAFARLEPAAPPRACLKRRRSVTDIDGPNTAALCCKKRRLRRYLITSRLSQPFSQPATHILNRESVASGDTRFLKLAAIINARRIVQLPLPSRASSLSLPSSLLPPSPSLFASPPFFSPSDTATTMIPVPRPPSSSEILRRLAMSNRFRRRILAEAAAGRKAAGVPAQQLAASARATSWTTAPAPPQVSPTASSEAAAIVVLAPCTVPSRSGIKPPLTTPPERARLAGPAATERPLMIRPVDGPHPNPLGSWRVLSIPESPVQPSRDKVEGLQKNAVTHVAMSHEQTAVSTTATNVDVDKDDEDDDDDGDGYCAFPGSQNESRYEASDDPDPDDVYSDFSVLFRVPAEDSDFGEEGFDDYMDELDGIAHLPR